MAARVLLLGILFTEVLEPVCAAGVRGSSGAYNGKTNSKIDGADVGLTKGSEATLEIEPGGSVVLGKKSITLGCRSSGDDQDIFWLYDDVPVSTCEKSQCGSLKNGSIRFEAKKQNLQLRRKTKGRKILFSEVTKISETHEWRCVARTNSGGLLRSSPVYIKVAELSRNFEKPPENQTVREGEITRFSCIIDSVPFPPNITWQHNGKNLSVDSISAKYYLVPPGVLYISATKLSDAGSYRCIATNGFINKTKKSKVATLTVLSPPSENESRTPVSLFPQVSYNHRLINGSNFTLACAAAGFPSPTVAWMFLPRNPDGALPRILVNSTKGIAILSLKNLSPANAGIYVCTVKNIMSDGHKLQNVTLDVMVPPSFLKKPTSQSFPSGRTVRFECQAEGTPTPKIYWLKDSANATTNSRRTTYVKDENKMELAISATVPSDSGIYQCVAVNPAGEIWAAGRLQVNTSRNSPAVPTSLKCHAPSPVKILISWEPPKSLPSTSITAYTVHYSPAEGGKEEVSPPQPGNSTSVEITNHLEPFTNYSFYVRVWANNLGASDQSATIVCSTAPGVPKAAPKLKINVLSSTKINVSWIPLTKKEARGTVEEYKIQWRLHDEFASPVDFVPSTVEHYTITDLIPGARYDIRVLARTRQGWPNVSEPQLPWTSVILRDVENDKSGVKNFVHLQIINLNDTTVKITWNRNEGLQKYLPGLNFDSWRVYCENSKGHKIINVALPINSTEYLFTNLETNVSYTMGLCMMNSGVEIDCSTKSIESTQVNPDNVPIVLQVAPVASTKILVAWTMPNKNNVRAFEICYQLAYVPESEGTTKCIVVKGVDFKMIENLKPFTSYRFKLRTLEINNDKTSTFSESIECYTREDVPGKPEDVQWSSTNETNAKITWKQPIETNGEIQNYLITYTIDTNEPTLTWNKVTIPSDRRYAILNGLESGKLYEVTIRASTKAGYGRPADPIFIIPGSRTDSELPTKTDEQKPSRKTAPDPILGIIIGIGISICCITVCLCSIYCRNKCENSRSMRESVQQKNSRSLIGTGNGCCVARSATSVSQQATPQIACNEIELAELCPSSPVSTNPQGHAKVRHANGILENCVKEPLLTSWDLHDESKDLRITENPQCKQRRCPIANGRESEPNDDLNTTELTMIDCTLATSENSLNNNFGCTNDSPRKAIPISIPVLEPNG